MLTSEFDFFLPPELIAQHPLPQRDASRMMVVEREKGRISHGRFKDIPAYFQPGDVLVLNDSRVIPARVWGQAGRREVEFLLLKNIPAGRWEALCRPAKHVTKNSVISFGRDLRGRVIEVEAEGKRVLDFGKQDVLGFLEESGYAPLPPYIKRKKHSEPERAGDLARYQTVYARQGRSIAAPTAGLHFTPDILAMIEKTGVQVLRVNLDIGLATFQPVRAERLEDHFMLGETYTVSPQAAQEVNSAKKNGLPVTAVGTTVVRTLESAAGETGQDSPRALKPGTFSTGLFIYPGYKFKIVDRLLTNFHLPRSTLLLLVSAFAGRELIREAYRQAVGERYRFFSYGDCMLIV
ncbi:MAG: tRNA preQ1(34) S-adenosylmethionine ribosyltransferase-isomerase QueA [Candidatus Aminicenantales bacterium]